ncbi:MAG: CBS domain-containing protein [Actinomycetota bacterium]
MSPRAAWRLASLGFERVFDYVPGKADWSAAGLPLEGDAAEEATAGSAADPSVPTCALGDDLQHVRTRVRQTEWRQCIVVNDERIVLGRLGRQALEQDDEQTIEEAMAEGPSTVRPDEPLDKLLTRLERQQLETALVTTSEGRLVGVVRRARDTR